MLWSQIADEKENIYTYGGLVQFLVLYCAPPPQEYEHSA